MSDNGLLIMGTAGIVTVSGIVHETLTVKNKKVTLSRPKMKPVIGGFLLGIFLFGMNAVSGDVTHAVCILLIISALLLSGPAVVTALNVGKVLS